MVFSGYLLGGSSFFIEAKGDPMIETEDQRRWWFATHPEYSWSRRGIRSESKVDPRDVDKYVDEALKYETGPVADLLKSVKRNFGTQAYSDQNDQQPKEPDATIGPPKPPGLSDRARSVLDFVCPGLTKAYDRWRTGYYEAYPWAPGPLYDALADLVSLVAYRPRENSSSPREGSKPGRDCCFTECSPRVTQSLGLRKFPTRMGH